MGLASWRYMECAPAPKRGASDDAAGERTAKRGGSDPPWLDYECRALADMCGIDASGIPNESDFEQRVTEYGKRHAESCGCNWRLFEPRKTPLSLCDNRHMLEWEHVVDAYPGVLDMIREPVREYQQFLVGTPCKHAINVQVNIGLLLSEYHSESLTFTTKWCIFTPLKQLFQFGAERLKMEGYVVPRHQTRLKTDLIERPDSWRYTFDGRDISESRTLYELGLNIDPRDGKIGDEIIDIFAFETLGGGERSQVPGDSPEHGESREAALLVPRARPSGPVEDWTTFDVKDWLLFLKLDPLAKVTDGKRICGALLPLLRKSDWLTLGATVDDYKCITLALAAAESRLRGMDIPSITERWDSIEAEARRLGQVVSKTPLPALPPPPVPAAVATVTAVTSTAVTSEVADVETNGMPVSKPVASMGRPRELNPLCNGMFCCPNAACSEFKTFMAQPSKGLRTHMKNSAECKEFAKTVQCVRFFAKFGFGECQSYVCRSRVLSPQ